MPRDSRADEALHMNAIFHFLQALHLLRLPQGELQAVDQSDFLPWELQHDVMDVIPYVVAQTTVALTAAEVSSLQSLATRLGSLPAEAISGVDALRHPAWIGVRTEARDTQRALKPTIEAVERYFA